MKRLGGVLGLVLAIAFALFAACALEPGPARAAGYSIYEQGAAVLGMAGAGTASVHDASAVFFNPARLAQLASGTHVYAGGTMLTPFTSFAGVDPYPGYGVTEEMTPQQFFPPSVYGTYHRERWALGAGLDSPYGLGIEWKNPDQFTGRYIATKADLRTLQGEAAVAFAATRALSVALGADAAFTRVALQRRQLEIVPGGGGAQADVARIALDSDYEPAYGWNASVAWRAAPEWRVGASYRSKIVLHVDDARATFTQIPTGDPAFDAGVAAALPPNQKVSTVLRQPAMWSLGGAWAPAPEWTVEADVNWFEWSVFQDLPIRFEQTPSADVTLVEDYKDSFQIRVGAEHRLPKFTYRFGYYFDQHAAPSESVSPILPDADRHGVTLGLGFGFGPGQRTTLDVYDLAIFVPDRSTDGRERDGYDGTYHTFVNAAGLGLGWRW